MNMKLTAACLLPAMASIAVPVTSFAQVAAAPAASGDELSEIVVTATRREERLQDVPLSVSAISGDQLKSAGFQNLQDIQYQMSGVQFGSSPNDSGFRLRGVGTAGGFTSASEQSVGTVVDGVVVPFGNPVSSLGDVERVEVLKGPQGTQFGKNASSGVVSITTRRPDTEAFGMKVFASYADLNERNVNAAINVPVSSTAAFDLYAYDRETDGYVDNVVQDRKWGGQHSYGARGKFLWNASETFSAYFIADWSKTERVGPGQVWTINTLPSFANPLMAARFGPLLAQGLEPGFENEQSFEEFGGDGGEKNSGASLELNWSLGNYTLTSVSAYRKQEDIATIFGIDGIDLPVFTAAQSALPRDFLSEEIRLTSPSGETLEYVAGLFYSKTKVGYGATNCAQLRPALPFDPVIINISAGCSTTQTTSKSVAAFADGSVRLSDTFRLLGGVRVTDDKVNASSFSEIDPNFPPGPGPNGFVVPYAPRALATGETSKSDWSGRFGAEFKPSKDLMVFGTVARGYLGPTVTFSGLSGQQSEVKPQIVDDVTIGLKSQFADRRVTLNGNIFYDKYKNLQTSVFNGFEFLTENAGGFEAKGAEIELGFRITNNFDINMSYTYSDTEFTDYITSCPNSIVAQGPAAVAAQCNAEGSTEDTALFQAAGLPLTGAPRDSATFGANFRQPLGASLQLDAGVTYYYRSEVFYDVGNDLSRQGGYGTVGATVGFGDADDKWRVAAFVRNATDERFHAAVIGLPFADAGGEVNWNTREGRRTVGVSVEAKF